MNGCTGFGRETLASRRRPHHIYRCPSCAVAVWSVYGGAHKLLFVRVGTLDDAAALTPDVHIYARSKLPWVADSELCPIGAKPKLQFGALPAVLVRTCRTSRGSARSR
jgi:hypothetical protein